MLFNHSLYPTSSLSHQLLQWATALFFLGRAILFWFWGAPYRTFFWDEPLLGNAIETLGMSWGAYLSNVATDNNINLLVNTQAVIFLLASLSTFFYKKLPARLTHPLIFLAAIQMFLLALLLWKEKFGVIAQLFEYTLQIFVPILFLYWKKDSWKKSIYWITAAAIALTFTAHGLYAMGIFKTPGHFIGMTISILGINEDKAYTFLWLAGVLDLILAIGIFFKPKPAIWALLYAMFWGFLTTLARIVAHWNWNDLYHSFLLWVPESMIRTPHFLVPTALALYLYKQYFKKA
ncbi:MAG: hypothetical protein AAFO07_04450 [Bacteroidota bacterium]